MKRGAGSGLLLAVLWAALAAPAMAGWRPLAEPAPAFASWNGREVGAAARNPVLDIPAQTLRGAWLRFSGDVDSAASGMQFLLTALENDAISTRSVPSLCVARGPSRARCSSVLWVPPQATRVRLVVWAAQAPGHIQDVQLETAAGRSAVEQPHAGVEQLLGLVQERYYRSDEVDWPALRAQFDAIPAPPADVDPLPTMAQLLRDRLPGNRHTSIRLAHDTNVPASDIELPTCRQATPDVWVLRLPGALFTAPSAVQRYVRTAHRCMRTVPVEARWIVDLRGNGGGNMLPMLASIEEFFPPGPLLTFLDGRRRSTGLVSLARTGIVQDGRIAVAYPTRPGRRRTAPVGVLMNSNCGSSCEVVVASFLGRPQTRLFGQATSGLTTGNVPHPLGEHYSLFLTEGYMADRCGLAVPERIAPDVALDPGDEAAAIAQVRAMPSAPTRNKPTCPLGPRE